MPKNSHRRRFEAALGAAAVQLAVWAMAGWAMAGWACPAASAASLSPETRPAPARAGGVHAVAPVASTRATASVALPPVEFVPPDAYATWVETAGTSGSTDTYVMVGDRVAWSLHGEWASMAGDVTRRLNAAWRAGDLRSDEVTPGKRGRTYVIRCGQQTLLDVDRKLAADQGMRPAEFTLAAIDGLRSALGGVPLVRQVSRGGLLGARPRIGVASWYGGFFNGRTAADGSRFDKTDFTVASKTIKLGTLLLVVNPRNGKAVLVRVTDRGPYVRGRNLDLSQRTAQVLGIERAGVAKIRYFILPS